MPEVTAPALLDVRKPGFTLPNGACDCHAHLYGTEEEYRRDPSRGFDPAPGSFQEYLSWYKRLHEVLGFSRGVLVHSNVYGTDNQVTVDALRELGPQYRAVALVEPDVSHRELAQLRESGVKAIRVNLVSPDPFGFEALERYAEDLRKLDLHVEIIMNCSDLPDYDDRIRRLAIPVVIDHHGRPDVNEGVGGTGFQTLLSLLRDGVVWVKASAPYRFSKQSVPYPDAKPFTEALIATNSDRILWGSDWPHVLHKGEMPNDGDLLQLFVSAVPDDQTLHKVLVDNPAALYGF